MRLYKEGLVASWELFGFSRHFLFFVGVILFFMAHSFFTVTTLFLDHLFFRKFRQVNVRQPVIIIGHPRSGTTFIHHLFTQTNEMAAFTTWQLLFPAITARKIVKPIVRFLTRKKPMILIPEEAGHQISLDIYYTGKTQIFAQTHFSTHRIKTLLEVFPDAKFIYMHRMPEDTLPSYLSLNHNTLDILWGMHRFSETQKAVFNNRRYRHSLELYRYFYDLWHNDEIDKEKVLIVDYKKLRNELMPMFEQIVEFTQIRPSRELRHAVALQAQRQQTYQRKHQVKTLADFGIDKEQVRKDFAFLYTDDPFGELGN
jgi:LPS sulfotransferase NodH